MSDIEYDMIDNYFLILFALFASCYIRQHYDELIENDNNTLEKILKEEFLKIINKTIDKLDN